jgi:ABC-type transporter Mla MlaB component
MRANGSVLAPAGLTPGNHLCWPYENPAHFEQAARTYVSDGLLLGERVLAVVDERMRGELLRLERPLPRADAFGPSLQVLGLAEVYGSGINGNADRRTPCQHLDFYVNATRQALADGYAGLRVVAEVTGLASEPAPSGDVFGWEHLADEFISSGLGLSAMCGYRSDLLDPEVVAELACLHPLVRTPLRESAFGLFFDGSTMTLAGTVETFSADRLHRVLFRSHVQSASDQPGAQITLDLSGLDFIDGHGLSVLADWARSRQGNSSTVRLIGMSLTARTVWAILGYDHELPAVTVLGR